MKTCLSKVNLIKNVRLYLDSIEYEHTCVCQQYKLKEPLLSFTVRCLWLDFIRLVGLDKDLCRLLGHKWISDDYASPDSGYIGQYCIRCGKSYGTKLY
jgi:hypothetical protein